MKDSLWTREENPPRKKYLHQSQFKKMRNTKTEGKRWTTIKNKICHPEPNEVSGRRPSALCRRRIT
jgi:hypothetical protein